MEITALQAFVEVADRASFSEAAEALYLTQPAVSKRVALLESELDTRLFDRIGRRVSLTPTGSALLPRARRLINDVRELKRLISDISGEVRGRLVMGTSHHIGLHRLPPVLSGFSRAYPAVNIDIDFMDSEQAYELIMQGEVELAVVTLAPQAERSVIAEPVWHDPLDFMVAVDHPLARARKLDLARLASHPAVLPGLTTYTGQIVKGLFDRHGLQLQVSMATNYLETIRMLASVGLGWTVLPRSMADASLRRLEVGGARIERTLGVVYHRGRSLSRAARAFIDAVASA